MTRTGALLLLRHGQSVSNAADVFTGWSDPPLSDLGDAAFRAWRRSYTIAPPPMSDDAAAVMYADDRYTDLAPADRPRTESLADVWERTRPYWTGALRPRLRSGGTPLVVGHGNSLRALVMHLEHLGPADVERLDIPTAVPMLYRLDRQGDPIADPAGRYLDPIAAGEPVRIGRPD